MSIPDQANGTDERIDAVALIRRLEAFPAVLAAAIGSITSLEARWKPPTGAWSILEIACHLVDEERDDFRMRLRMTLTEPGSEWPPIDPEGWAQLRRYNERELGAVLDEFVRERRASVAWLMERTDGPVRPAWRTAHEHARLGDIRAGDLLAAWAAHDALHLRQIAKRLFELAARDAGDFSIGYAGSWGP